jgi:hypothetical protein
LTWFATSWLKSRTRWHHCAASCGTKRRHDRHSAKPRLEHQREHRPGLTDIADGLLLWQVAPSDEQKVATCQRLLMAGANPLAVDSDGRSALHYAARRASTALMRLFLNRACDPHAGKKAGRTSFVKLCNGQKREPTRPSFSISDAVPTLCSRRLTKLILLECVDKDLSSSRCC